MAAPSPSSLSRVCRSVADFVWREINAGALADGLEKNVEEVTLGNPAAVASGGKTGAGSDIQRLNLFFYRFEPFEYAADLLPGETWMMRTHCLITPFACSEENISAGENDLRLLGEVMRAFHEMPVQKVEVEVSNGEKVDFHIQAIFEPLSTEAINQIWSTQGGDVAYRPSVSYEISLAPVLPKNKAVDAPLVGAAGFQMEESMSLSGSKKVGEDYSGLFTKSGVASEVIQTPMRKKVSVNTTREEWAPAICFVYDNICADSLIFSSPPDHVEIKIAGKKDDEIKLYWDVWDKNSGWKSRAAEDQFKIIHSEIDPNQLGLVDKSLTVPIVAAGQAALYAERAYKRIPEEPERTVRSNLLLLSIYEKEQP